MTVADHPIGKPKSAADQTPAQSTTRSPEILQVTSTVIWCSSSAQAKRELDTILSTEPGQSVSRSQEYSQLATEALLASRNRKIDPKAWAKKLAKDLSDGID
jgi:hypothetical protein